jgi:hypothetical protein
MLFNEAISISEFLNKVLRKIFGSKRDKKTSTEECIMRKTY